MLEAAVVLAARDGIESLTMRKLADELGAGAMSLYHYVANKDELLDGMVDIVFGEIEVPSDVDWKTAMRRRAISAREALMRHRWAIGLMEARKNPGGANLRHHNAVMGALREAGFSFEATVHASSVLDAYVYGFALQEKSLPSLEAGEETARILDARRERVPIDDYPYLLEVVVELPKSGYDFATEFEFGLDLILDGLDRYRAALDT
jgi:AcrR family transcriptional regulator